MHLRNTQHKRKGQALVEYAILLCGIALISLVAVSLIGHKTADLLGTVAVFLPGAHDDDNGPITSGKLVETTRNANGAIVVDVTKVTSQGPRLGNNLGVDLSTVILEP
jgi:hypothetical protein